MYQLCKFQSPVHLKHFCWLLFSSMPKERPHISVLKEARTKVKAKKMRYAPGVIYLQVLGSGAKGAPRSLYMFSDQISYIFNCGPGTQRLAHEHRMKLAKVEHIFITGKSWTNLGGLPSVLLTLQDIGIPSLSIHGPPGIEDLLVAARKFIILRDIEVKITDHANTLIDDSIMKVDMVPLYGKPPSNANANGTTKGLGGPEVELDNSDYYVNERNVLGHGGRRQRSPSPTGAPTTIKLNNSRLHDVPLALSYVCRLKPKPGTLLLEKCVERNVPPGPLLGKLKNGQDITLPDGTLVKSTDVCSPTDLGSSFIVVECPSEEFLNSLMENTILYDCSQPSDNPMTLVVHFTPQAVLETSPYQEWMARFPHTTRHIIMNDSNVETGFIDVHRIQNQLNLLDSRIFPLLSEQQLLKVRPSASNCESADAPGNFDGNKFKTQSTSDDDGSRLVQGNSLLMYHLRPKIGLDRSSLITLPVEEFLEEARIDEDFSDSLEAFKAQLKSLPRHNDKLESSFPSILFLGTGSCIPNKTRNTSAILLQMSASSAIMLDCGEGTYGQLVRFYGQEECCDVLIRLSAVYISHLHADHHLDLIQILQERKLAFLRRNIPFVPLLLIAPSRINFWLKLFDFGFEETLPLFRLQSCEIFLNGTTLKSEDKKSLQDTLQELNLTSFSTTYVHHCPSSFGVAISHKDGWKITYSGDTMPCEGLVNIGKDSTILIHEATMEDYLEAEAKVKTHSTTTQAIDVGQRMNAKFTILTHFSQRYSKIPFLKTGLPSNVGIAFDNMIVRLGDLPILPLMYSVLKSMFRDHYLDMENKTARKMMRQALQEEERRTSQTGADKGVRSSSENREPDLKRERKGDSL